MKYTFLILLLWATSLSQMVGQNIFSNTNIIGGFALGEQDRRLFYFPPADKVLTRNPKKLDYDLTLYLEKRFLKYHFWELNVGIGYAENNTLFGRPFNHSELDGIFTEELRFVRRYTINKMTLPISAKVHFGKFYLQIGALPAIAFRKSVLDRGDAFNTRFPKWQFTWNSLEINPGLGIRFTNRFRISVNYRWLYYHEIDKVIYNTSLLRNPNHEFLKQKSETYNPFKIWLMVGYKLKE